MGRQCKNTSYVVVLVAVFFLAKVSDNVCTHIVNLAHDIEPERIDVIVERLMIQEQLGNVAYVLAVYAITCTVNFEDTDIAFPVHLYSGGVREITAFHVSLQ